MKTIVMRCSCRHEFQDKTYGPSMRLHNISKSGDKAYCTVCSGNGRNAKMNSKSNPPTTTRPYKTIGNVGKFKETKPEKE